MDVVEAEPDVEAHGTKRPHKVNSSPCEASSGVMRAEKSSEPCDASAP